MPIVVMCARCQARLKAPDAVAGKRLKCPKCGGVIRVASEPPAAAPAPRPPAAPAPAPAPKSKAPTAPPVERAAEELPPDDTEDAPRPRKKAPKRAPVEDRPDDPAEDAPPRKSKSRKGGKAAKRGAGSALLRMAKVHMVPNTSLFAGRKKVFVKDPDSGAELGVIHETTFKVLGTANLLGVGPFKIEFPAKYEVRDGDSGPFAVRIRLERAAFRFQLSKNDWSARKWVVETAAGPVGGFVVSQTKGSATQLLDADGRPAGRIVAEMSVARRVVLVDPTGAEIGHVIGERSIENAEMVEAARKSGKVQVKLEVHTIFNRDKRGSFAVVDESRVGDPWAHAMVLGFGALVQAAGVFATLAGAKDPSF